MMLVDKVSKPIQQIQNNINKTATVANKTNSIMSYWPKRVQETISKTKELHTQFKKNNTLVEEFGSKLRSIFATYGGVMTIKAVIEVSDTITGAENRLNYANGGDAAATEDSMDKMYAAALRSRSDYGAMMSNVGKSMALAGDKAFQGNIDNAIRFQEIMAKSYAIGGASAAEQASSMYQMVQALGSGILQGDELRSVREGAPLAYQEIEKFAQKLLETDESLKDLASDGKITSDIVVAAMLNAGDSIDEAFGNTDMTIGQAFTNIKTTAVNSFRSIQDTINEFLNSEKGRQVINGISVAVQGLIGLLGILINAAANVVYYIANNWSWIQFIVYGIAAAVIYLATVAIIGHLWKALVMISTSNPFALWLIGIGLVIAGIVYLASVAKNGCDFIYNVCYILAMAIIAVLAVVLLVHTFTSFTIMSTTMMTVLFIIGIVLLLVMAIAKYGEQIGQIIGAVVAFVYNLIVGIVNAIIQFIWTKFVEPFIGIIEWVLNAANGGFTSFGGAVANLIGQIISWFLSLGKVVTKIIDAIFGTNWTDGLSSLQDSVLKWGKKEDAITISREAPTINSLTGGYLPDRLNYGDAINTGGNIGKGVQDGINNLFNKAKSGLGGLGDALNIGNNFDPNAAGNQLATTGYDPNALLKDVGDIDDNTSKIAKSTELSEEDLKYLRKVADMEWKKEYTTANVVVKMNNNNTINNQGDLDGWLELAGEKVEEVLQIVADGVYV